MIGIAIDVIARIENLNVISFLFVSIFLVTLVKGFYKEFTANNLIENLKSIKNIIILLGCVLVVPVYINYLFYEDDFNNIILNAEMLVRFKSSPAFIYTIVIPILTLISYLILKLITDIILNITVFNILHYLDKRQCKNSRRSKRFFGVIYSVPKAIAYIVVLSFIIYIASFKAYGYDDIKIIKSSNIYMDVKENLITPLISSELVENFQLVIEKASEEVAIIQEVPYRAVNTITYYNGITIEEGIKGNQEIADKVKNICADKTNDREKARVIYNWISSEIEYDLKKAEEITNDNFTGQSGAISAYEIRKGVCLDYACLYATMSLYANLDIRIISGKGFDGTNWVNHSWNQVYLREEDKWINVDTTFSNAGNYFDNVFFDLDHKEAEIIGEWKSENGEWKMERGI